MAKQKAIDHPAGAGAGEAPKAPDGGSIDPNGPHDALQVSSYLRLKASDRVVMLAALMAPKADVFDPAALIDHALDLQAKVEARVIRRREELALEMDRGTVVNLLNRLGVRDLDKPISNDDPRHLDPVIGPALMAWHYVLYTLDHDAVLERRFEEGLAAADARTVLARPKLPCTLEVALRYAANAPDVPWEALVRGFADYEVSCQPEDGGDFSESGGASSWQRLEDGDPLGLFAAAEADEGEGPAPVAAHMVRSKAELYVLADKFNSFWGRLQGHYVAAVAKDQLAKDKRIATLKNTGGKGVQNREAAKWEVRTKAFIEHLKSRSKAPTPHFATQAVSEFVSNLDQVTSKAAKDDCARFFMALCRQIGKTGNAVAARIKADLANPWKEKRSGRKPGPKRASNAGPKRGKFKGLTTEAIENCLQLLNEAVSA